jgi:hypothetical protein
MTPFARRVRVECAVAAVLVGVSFSSAQPPKPVAMPPADEVKVAIETLKDVFDKDYAAAETDAQAKRALAEKLLKVAPQRKAAAMVFACYDEARRLAATGGDVKTALAAVEAMSSRFTKLPDKLRLDTLSALSKSELTTADAATIARLAQDEAAAALDREAYTTAVELAEIAAAAAKKAEDLDLANEARAFKTKAVGLVAAVATLKANPNDPEANTTLGTYWAFDRGRWNPGLQYLSKSSDKALAEAARRDLAKPTTAKDRTAVADLWYKLAADAPDNRKRLFVERAWEWYSAALAVATGDDDLKPGERLKAIEAAHPNLFHRTFDGHTAAVAAVAVTHDGTTLVSGGNDNTVRVWDAVTGKLLRTLEGHAAWVGSVVVTPAGEAVTAGGDNVIRIWDLKTGKEVAALQGHAVAVRGLALTADGKSLVSGASDKTVRLWNLTDGKEVRKYGDGKESVESVAVTADGKYVLAGSDAGVVTVYDAKTGGVVSQFDRHRGSMVYTIAVTADGKTAVSGARDKTIRVWEVATGKELRVLGGHTEQVYQVVLSPDEKQILSASFDRTVRIWDFATGKELKKFEGHTDGVQGACYSPDGRSVFSASWDKSVRKWRIPAGLAP